MGSAKTEKLPPKECEICGRELTIDISGGKITSGAGTVGIIKDGHINAHPWVRCCECGTVFCTLCAEDLFILQTEHCKACQSWLIAASQGEVSQQQIAARAKKVRGMRGGAGWINRDFLLTMFCVLLIGLFGSAVGWFFESRKSNKAFGQRITIKQASKVGKIEPLFKHPATTLGALSLIRWQESKNGRLDGGDNNLARGQMQFHEAAWNRGLKPLGKTNDPEWQWPAATKETWKCYAVTIARWQLDCPQALEHGRMEALIRYFRLPNNPGRKDNHKYYEDVTGPIRQPKITVTGPLRRRKSVTGPPRRRKRPRKRPIGGFQNP